MLDYISYKQLNWYGQVRRIKEEKLSQKILNCVHLEKKGGRPRISWMMKVTTVMWEKRISNMEWIDREEWRRKLKLYELKFMKTLILCT